MHQTLRLAERIVVACPSAALLVGAEGEIRLANGAASRLLELAPGSASRAVRDLLGVGYRELELVAREGESDVVAELVGPPHRIIRIRPESVPDSNGGTCGLIAFLEPAPPAGGSSRHQVPAFDALFGTDPGLLATKQAALRFAGTELPILLLAETGTGKELLARAIHAASPRAGAPFVAINCGALSPQLLESELFGYAPGAFTGANRDGAEGKIGAARGGTLFLDELAEMPPSLQSLLLRVLENGTYYRVGDSRPRSAEVRIIAATCRDLPQQVASGAFRDDLYYRIAGACLGLPPVRQRDDLPQLAEHLLAELADRLSVPVPSLSEAASSAIEAEAWPGNVRQLKTALHYAMVLAGDQTIEVHHLPAPSQPRQGHGAVAVAPTTSAPGPRTLEELERDRLQKALAKHAGHLTRAAAELGIARSTLYRRLRRHGFLPNPPPGSS